MTGTPQRHERKQNAASTNPQEISNGTAKEDIVSPRVIELVHHNKHHLLSHSELPDWLRGNEFLSHFHRPPMPCFRSCFKSIFKLHSETGNIWTHLIGFIAFVCITSYMLVRPVTEAYPFPGDWREKLVFSCFFVGAILCLGVSWIFHTVYCHSKTISKIFRRLDYAGIAIFIMGSFIPPLYYGFYCSRVLKIVYMSMICSLGVICIIVSLWDKFSAPHYRLLRAGIMLSFGYCGFIPVIHLICLYGITLAYRQAAGGWVALMCLLYTASAVMYATRIPERFFPGKCDIWFQSHQIFHLLVLAAAFVHLYGICQMAQYRFEKGTSCESWTLPGSFFPSRHTMRGRRNAKNTYLW